MERRIINLGNGSYNAYIRGDYIENKSGISKEKIVNKNADEIHKDEEEKGTINTNGGNYFESIDGDVYYQ